MNNFRCTCLLVMRHIGLEVFDLTMTGTGLKKERKKKIRLPRRSDEHLFILWIIGINSETFLLSYL